MTAIRMLARDIMSEEQLAAVRERSTWRGIALIVHAWALIFGSIALVAWWPNPLTFLLAVAMIGSRQLGLAILMHDGAHGCLSPDEKLNLWLSQWFCAFPVFAETRAYRRYHLQHHAHTQQEDDPDLVLSAPFPITPASYRRKFLRDITGQTGYQQRKAQFLNALGHRNGRCSARGTSGRSSDRNSSPMAVCLALAAAGVWWALSAVVAAAVPDLADGDHAHPQHRRARRRSRQRRSVTQHAHDASEFARAAVHRAVLRELSPRASPAVLRARATICHACTAFSVGRHASRMEVQPGYASVLRLAMSKPNSQDRPARLPGTRAAPGQASRSKPIKAAGF